MSKHRLEYNEEQQMFHMADKDESREHITKEWKVLDEGTVPEWVQIAFCDWYSADKQIRLKTFWGVNRKWEEFKDFARHLANNITTKE